MASEMASEMTSGAGERAVIVAVARMRVMQVTIDQVVDMVAMWNGLVAASRTVNVSGHVTVTRVPGRAAGGMHRIDCDRALVDVIAVDVVQMAFVEIVDVAVVFDGAMAATRAVDVIVLRMNLVVAHHGSFRSAFVTKELMAGSMWRVKRAPTHHLDALASQCVASRNGRGPRRASSNKIQAATAIAATSS
jgi:hypothetical protein